MKISITVKDRAEKEAIERAMSDPQTRAFVVVVGTLLPFSDRARRRILNYVADRVEEDGTSKPVNFSIEGPGGAAETGDDETQMSGHVPVRGVN